MIKKATDRSKVAWGFLSPSLLLYFLYIIFPIFYTFYLSFTDWDGLSSFPLPICLVEEDYSCFDNYIQLFEDPVFWSSFTNNLIWLGIFSLSPLLGLALALFFHVKSPVASVYKSLFFTPMVFSLVVVGMIWGWFMQPQFGLLDTLMHWLGVLGPEEQFDYLSRMSWESTLCLIIAACWPHASYCMILYLAGLSNLQKNVIEAALIDGVSKFQLFWHIILPMLRPATTIVVIVTMIGALRVFDIVSIMTAGGPANSTNVLALYMYQETFQNFRYGFGAAIAVILFLISLGLIFVYLKKSGETKEESF
jgi:multiple sugar transport system permease protein